MSIPILDNLVACWEIMSANLKLYTTISARRTRFWLRSSCEATKWIGGYWKIPRSWVSRLSTNWWMMKGTLETMCRALKTNIIAWNIAKCESHVFAKTIPMRLLLPQLWQTKRRMVTWQQWGLVLHFWRHAQHGQQAYSTWCKDFSSMAGTKHTISHFSWKNRKYCFHKYIELAQRVKKRKEEKTSNSNEEIFDLTRSTVNKFGSLPKEDNAKRFATQTFDVVPQIVWQHAGSARILARSFRSTWKRGELVFFFMFWWFPCSRIKFIGNVRKQTNKCK